MMRTKNKLLFIINFIFFSLFMCHVAFAEETWTIATTKFSYSKGQKQDSVTDATAAMFPARILENISLSLSRSIPQDEALERIRYKSKQDRASLFLQMSGLIQKRDVLFLGNYSDKELKEKIAAQEKEIQNLRDKITKNLEDLKAEEEKYENSLKGISNEAEGFAKYLDIVRDFLGNEENNQTNEKITLYRNDVKTVFTPSVEAESAGLNSSKYEKELISAGIDGLITGVITSYGDFMSLTVSVYSVPGMKEIGSVTEVGSLAEAEYISKSIARQLVPLITNSLPINVTFSIEPESLRQKTSLYVDEQFFNELPSNLVLESGVHRLEFASNGYRHISTSYYFEGNHTYNISATMEEELHGNVNINLANPMEGSIFGNGILQKNISVFEDENGNKRSDSASIAINGKTILGQFISSDGTSAFFYISEDLIGKQNDFSLKIKTFDRSEYIEKRRKIMYQTYSALVVSLIPSMYVNSQYKAYANYLEKNPYADESIKQKADTFGMTKNIFTGIAVTCGALFAYEFVRYLMAANTVLPVSAKKDMNFIYYENPNLNNLENEKTLGDVDSNDDFSNGISNDNEEISTDFENQTDN